MANDSIYLMSGDELVEMRSEPYESEDLLQELLAKHPDLLAGSQMHRDIPRRWLLVRRELGVPGKESEASRFSLDHQFIDQDGIPTLVEVKRSTDTRLRREVVGQMLDYAANGSKYWTPDTLKAEFEARCAVDGVEANSLLAEHLAGGDARAFWANVGENITTGQLRLVFLADVIPPELQRIIEFLNEQTVRTEVLGVEVRQYVGQGHQTLVPRVVGQTIAAQQTKVASPKKSYDELLADAAPETREAEQLLREWAERHDVKLRRSAAGLQFLTAIGVGVFQLFPGWDSVEIPIQEARTGSDDASVEAFFESLRECRSAASLPTSIRTCSASTWWMTGKAQAGSCWTTGSSSFERRCHPTGRPSGTDSLRRETSRTNASSPDVRTVPCRGCGCGASCRSLRFQTSDVGRAPQQRRAGHGWCPGLPPVEIVEEAGEQAKTTTVRPTSRPYVAARVGSQGGVEIDLAGERAANPSRRRLGRGGWSGPTSSGQGSSQPSHGRRVMKCLDRLREDGLMDVAVLRGDGGLLDAHVRRALPSALREVGLWPPAATPLEEKKRRRLGFIERLYQRTDGDTMRMVGIPDTGAELGWSEEEAYSVARYLGEEGLLRFPAKGSVALTHAGVIEMEAALENPQEPTAHFPPLSIVNIYGDVVDSQIQAGTEGSAQHRSSGGTRDAC